MTKLTNTSPLFRASAALITGAKNTNAGIAHAIVGLMEVMTSPIKYKLNKEHPQLFTVADYAHPRRKEDGKVDGVDRAARLTAIMKVFFCMTDETPKRDELALKSGFAKAFPAALYLYKTAGAATIKNDTIAGIPLHEAVDLYDDKGAPNARYKGIAKQLEAAAALDNRTYTEGELAERITALKVTADGTTHATFGPLPTASQMAQRWGVMARDKGMLPAKAKRDRESKAADVGTLNNALRLVGDIVKRAAHGEESEFAFNDAHRSRLAALMGDLVAYFETDPID